MIRDGQKYFVCKTMRMSSFLLEKGFKPVAVIPDKNNCAFVVWLYDLNQDGFKECLDAYLQRVQQFKNE